MKRIKLLHYGLSLLTAGAALLGALAPAQAADRDGQPPHAAAMDLLTNENSDSVSENQNYEN